MDINNFINGMKRHCTTFGFKEIDYNFYRRNAKGNLGDVYLIFSDSYLVFYTADTSVHMTYDDILYNLKLNIANHLEGFNERTIFSQALELLRK